MSDITRTKTAGERWTPKFPTPEPYVIAEVGGHRMTFFRLDTLPDNAVIIQRVGFDQ